MELRRAADIPLADLLDLYDSVGWSAYTARPDVLERAIRGSSYVVSLWEGGELVALARCVSDDASIAYIQDILVRPARQRQGLGRRLVADVLERYAHVRQTVLLTDDRPEQLAFYESLGFQNTRTAHGGSLNALVLFHPIPTPQNKRETP